MYSNVHANTVQLAKQYRALGLSLQGLTVLPHFVVNEQITHTLNDKNEHIDRRSFIFIKVRVPHSFCS